MRGEGALARAEEASRIFTEDCNCPNYPAGVADGTVMCQLMPHCRPMNKFCSSGARTCTLRARRSVINEAESGSLLVPAVLVVASGGIAFAAIFYSVTSKAKVPISEPLL